MNKARLDWVMSGLNQYALTQAEDQFIKSASGDFDQKQMLTECQEVRLENLYKEKSKSKPNKILLIIFLFRNPPKKGQGPETFCERCFNNNLTLPQLHFSWIKDSSFSINDDHRLFDRYPLFQTEFRNFQIILICG